MATLEQILYYRNLTGVIQTVKSGIPSILPEAFHKPGRSLSGNRGEYFRITGTRQVARQVMYGAPAKRRELRDIDNVPFTMIHSFEGQQWPMALMVALTKMDSLERDEKGREQAEYQTREFKRLFSNLRIATALYALFQGKICFDTGGNLTTTTNATAGGVTVDYQIPANNTGSLNSTLTCGWNNATAPIMTDLLKLQTTAAKATGYELTHAFYDDTVPGYIGRNTEAQNFLKLNPAMNQHYLTTGAIPNGFGGIAQWIPAGKAFFNDKNGTNQKIISTDGVVFTPDPSEEWWEIFQGSYLVPNSVLPVLGGDSSLIKANSTEVFGMFGYGMLTLNPFMVEQVAGDTFFPAVKVPASLYQAVVNF